MTRLPSRLANRLIRGPRAALGAPLLLAAITYVPLLLTAPGRVAADTKQYLYLDPGRLLGRAPFLWDPSTHLGTVSHQTIGYLFPMGPYYWSMERLGVPVWVAQRLWLATLLFMAGLGVLYLARTLGWPRRAAVVAAFVYALSPYALNYAARISALLLPWAALPWLIAFSALALRRGGWRYPAIFALVVLTVGSVNATALLYAGIGPVLWFPFAVWVTKEAPLRAAAVTMARIGVLTLVVSAYWISGLAVQAGFGPPVLAYSETVDAVATGALSLEVVRGLGYWFFYGEDKLGPWVEVSAAYTQRLWLLAAGYGIAIAGIVSAVPLRWRHRAYFVTLAIVGLVVAVGVHPFDAPSPLGRAFRELATGSTVGLALRSSGRATPLFVLAIAMLLGAAVLALSSRARRVASGVAISIIVLAVVNLPPLWEGTFVGEHLLRDEQLPEYWLEAVDHLERRGAETRVLEIPGSDFAAYRWGNTVDPITPGLMDRPYAARELVGFGTAPANDLLIALDRRLQERVFEPEALAPVARFMGVGDVVVRSDLQFERYRTPRPRHLWAEVTAAPGLESPVAFGEPVENRSDPSLPLRDEIALGELPDLVDPPPVAVFGVEDALPIVRARSARNPVVLVGSGEGLVEAAAAGVLDGSETVLYSAWFADRPAMLEELLDRGAQIVVTDTNRRQARRWRTVRHNYGYTELAGERPLVADLSDARLDVFPDAGDDTRTVAEHRGPVTVRASGYGNPVSYTPEDRPVHAVDGDLDTAWRVGAFWEVRGEQIVVEFRTPREIDHVTLIQPLHGHRNRHITRARLHLSGPDGDSHVDVDLEAASLTSTGQRVDVEPRRIQRLAIEVIDTNVGEQITYAGLSGVGFADIRIPGVEVEEVIRLPRHPLDVLGARTRSHPLTVVMARARTDASEAVKEDDELAIVRSFELPTSRNFSVSGTARLSDHAPDELVDQLLGIPGAAEGGVTARSSARLPGALGARASSAIDGNLETAWIPPFADPRGQWIEVELPEAIEVDRLDFAVLADGRHSIPTRVHLIGDDRDVVTLDLPPVEPGDGTRTAARLPVALPEPLRARVFRLVIDDVVEYRTRDWYSLDEIVLPPAIAEFGIPGVRLPAVNEELPSPCRSDLLEVAGNPVSIRISGSLAGAVRRDPLEVEPCGSTAEGVGLDAGDVLVRAARGNETGVDLDRVVLVSAAEGGVGTAGARGRTQSPDTNVPSVEVISDRRTSLQARVHGAREPFWLVLGQGYNDGWTASIEDGPRLGSAELIDGFANGWYIDPADRDTFTVSLTWTPQRLVWAGLGISLIGALVCIGLLVGTRWTSARRRRKSGSNTGPGMSRVQDAGTHFAVLWDRNDHGIRGFGVVIMGLLVAVVAAILTHPLGGVVAGSVTAVALRARRLRSLAGFVGAALVSVSALYVIGVQARRGYPPSFGWPSRFDAIHWVAMLGVLLVGAQVAVDAVRERGGPFPTRNVRPDGNRAGSDGTGGPEAGDDRRPRDT